MHVRVIIVDAPPIGCCEPDRKALFYFTPPETSLVQRIHEMAYGLICQRQPKFDTGIPGIGN